MFKKFLSFLKNKKSSLLQIFQFSNLPIFKIMLSALFLTLSAYATAEVELYSGGVAVIESTPTVTIDGTKTDFSNNNDSVINSGIKGFGTITVETETPITVNDNVYGIYLSNEDEPETLEVIGSSAKIEIKNNLNSGIYVNNGNIDFYQINSLLLEGNKTGVNLNNSSFNIRSIFKITGSSDNALFVNTSSVSIKNSSLEISNNNSGIYGQNTANIEITGSTVTIKDNSNYGIFADNTSNAVIEKSLINISNNDGGIYGQNEAEPVQITGSTIGIILKDDNKLALNNVSLENNEMTISYSQENAGYYQKSNFSNVINNVTGSNNRITISGFNEAINLADEEVEDFCLNNKITAVNNKTGVMLKNKNNLVLSSMEIDSVNNDVGFEINNSSVTVNPNFVLADNTNGLIIKDSLVYSNFGQTTLTRNKEYGFKIENSGYHNDKSAITISAEEIGQGMLVSSGSVVTFNTTDLTITSSTANGLEVKSSTMTVKNGIIIIENNKNGYGVYADAFSSLSIRNADEIKINNNQYGIYADGNTIIQLTGNNIELKDNSVYALRNVYLENNAITISQSLRNGRFTDKLSGQILGFGNSLAVSGFEEGINLSNDMFGAEGVFSRNLSSENNGYGFLMENLENYELTGALKKIQASSNTVGFQIINSSAAISVNALEVNYSQNNGMEIDNSTVTINSRNVKLLANNGYGLKINNSKFNTANTDIQLQGNNQNGKGMIAENSEINFVDADFKIKEVELTGLDIKNSKVTGVGSYIEISSISSVSSESSVGLKISGLSEVNLSAGIRVLDDKEIPYGNSITIKDVEEAIFVENGSSLKIATGTINIENAIDGIVGQQDSNIEIIGSKLNFNNITGDILVNVTLIGSTFTVIGEGDRETNFMTKVRLKENSYGNTLTMENFDRGLVLTADTQNIFSGGILTANNNNQAITINGNMDMNGGSIVADTNTTVFVMRNANVKMNEMNIDMKGNGTGFEITNSKLDMNEVYLNSEYNNNVLNINKSTVTITNRQNNISIMFTTQTAIEVKVSSVNIVTNKDIKLEGGVTGISNSNSYVGITLEDDGSSTDLPQLIIKNINNGLIVANGGKTEISGGVSIEGSNNRGVYLSGKESKLKVKDIAVQDGQDGIYISGGSFEAEEINILNNKNIGLTLLGQDSKISFNKLSVHSNVIGISVNDGGCFEVSTATISLKANTKVGLQAVGKDSEIQIQDGSKIAINTGGEISEVIFKADNGGRIDFFSNYSLSGKASEASFYAVGNSSIVFSNAVTESGGSTDGAKVTKVGLLAEDGGYIEAGSISAKSNLDSGIQISGKNSSIKFDNLTAENNEYGIKVTAGANYELSNSAGSINMTLQENTVGIGVIGATMTIASAGKQDIKYNEIGMLIDNNGYLNVEKANFSLNENTKSGIEIKGKSNVYINGKLQTNSNKNGILLSNGGRLNASEIETSGNINGILIQDNNDVQIQFSTLTANGNINGINVTRSSWTLSGYKMKFSGNTNAAINIEGSTVMLKDISDIECEDNEIFLSIKSTGTYSSTVTSETDMEIEGNKKAGVEITGLPGFVSELNFETYSKKLVSKNNGNGIIVGSYGKLAADVVEVLDNKEAGLKINGEKTTLNFNKLISKNNNYGIEIEELKDGSDINITGETEIENNKTAGLYVNKSSVTLSTEINIGNNGTGILVNESVLDIKDNIKISGNNVGIEIVKSTVTGNIESEYNTVGIKIKESSTTLKNVKLSTNTYGITVEAGENLKIQFENLEVAGNKQAGIYVNEGTMVLDSNLENVVTEGNNNVAEVVGAGTLIVSNGLKLNNSLNIKEEENRRGNGAYIAGKDSVSGKQSLLKIEGIIEASNNENNGIIAENEGKVDAQNGKIIAKGNGNAGINAKSGSEINIGEIEIENGETGEYGLYAEGAGKIKVITSGSINGGKVGIYAKERTELNEEGFVYLENSDIYITNTSTAIKVNGINNIDASNATLSLSGNATGIEIENGSINIASATISGNSIGVNVAGNGLIEGKNIYIDNNGTAISVIGGNNFEISNNITNLSLSINTIGLLASGTGSKITVKKDLTTKGNETLIKAESNGTVDIKLNDLTLEGSTTAISAVSGGSVTGKNITLTGNTVGIDAQEGGNIIFSGTINVTGNETGLNLAGGAISAGSISITGNTVGAEVTSAVNNLKTAAITGNETGIKMTGGKLNITNATIEGNTIGIELGNGTELSADELRLSGNTKGISVKEGNNASIAVASLSLLDEMDKITISGGTLNIQDTNITKGTGEVFESEGGIINLTGGLITAESLIKAINGATITSRNNQIESKIKDEAKQVTLKLTDNSSWALNGDSEINQLELENSTVKIGTNTLTVWKIANNDSGTATGGSIEMEVDITEKYNDRLVIKEGASGKYEIKVTGVSKEISKEEIEEQVRIISDESSKTDKKTFSLSRGRVNINGYVYRLYQGSQLNLNSINLAADSNINGMNTAIGSGSFSASDWFLVKGNEESEYIKGIVRASELMTFIAKSGMNTMNKRVGDIRRTPEDSYNGVWVRTFGKNYDVKEGIKSSMSLFGVEGGYDMRISRNSQDRYYIGAMIGYQSAGSIKIEQEDTEKDSTGEGSAPSFGIYGSWIGQDGWYADVAARYIMVETKMKGYDNDNEIEYKPKANYVGFSAEVGKEIDINMKNGALIRLEPKIEISMAQRATSKADVSDGSEIEFGGGNSINGKLGISAGYQIELENDKELTPFIELAYNNEFEGKTDVNYIGEQYSSDLSGGGVEISAGLNGYLGKGFNVYSLLSYESGSKQSNFGWNIGLRYGFGGNKELTKNNIKKKAEVDEIAEAIDTVKDTRYLQRVVVLRNQALEKTQEGQVNKVEIADDNKYIKQSEITNGQIKYIKELADGLSTDKIEKIIIASHVMDNTGDERLNKKISVEKAKRVKQIMIRAGIEEDKIEIRGYGSKKQVADNGSKEGRNKNNRVEIFIKR